MINFIIQSVDFANNIAYNYSLLSSLPIKGTFLKKDSAFCPQNFVW